MSEWLKEHAWKACVGQTLPWVRIPLSPPTPSRCSVVLRGRRAQARHRVLRTRRGGTSPGCPPDIPRLARSVDGVAVLRHAAESCGLDERARVPAPPPRILATLGRLTGSPYSGTPPSPAGSTSGHESRQPRHSTRARSKLSNGILSAYRAAACTMRRNASPRTPDPRPVHRRVRCRTVAVHHRSAGYCLRHPPTLGRWRRRGVAMIPGPSCSE